MIKKYLLFIIACCNLLLQAVTAQEQGPKGIWATEWSYDGKYVAIGGDDSTVWLYRGNDYMLHKSFKLNSMVKALSWHPGENLLAIATMKGVQLLDIDTERFETIPGLKEGGRGIGWNHNGELLALGDFRGVVQVMDKRGKILRSIRKYNTNSYLALDWHPSEDIILTASDEFILFDTSGRQLNMFRHRKEATGILSVDWHPSGGFFASGDYGHEKEGVPTLLQFWKADGTLLKTIHGHRSEIRNLRWNKDGSLLATAGDALRIWSKDGDLLYTGGSSPVWGVTWNETNEHIITGTFGDGSVKLWDKRAGFIKEITQ